MRAVTCPDCEARIPVPRDCRGAVKCACGTLVSAPRAKRKGESPSIVAKWAGQIGIPVVWMYIFGAVCVLFCAAFGLAVCLTVYAWWPIEAKPAHFPNEAWILTCHTGSGEEFADESFSGPVLEGYDRNRGAGYASRVYPGTRVSVVVDVGRGSKISPGRYKLYGTVTDLDVPARRASLRDCVFVRK